MSWSNRRAALVLAAVTVLSGVAFLQNAYALKRLRKPVPPGVATPAPEPPVVNGDKDLFEFGALGLPKDNELKGKVEAAVDYIKTEDWEEATRLLQYLLDRKEDVYAKLKTTSPDGKEVESWLSVKREANRLLGTLPPKGLEFYKVTYEPEAAKFYKKALATGDRRLMGTVMARYLYTDSGAAATEWLGTYMLDRGESIAAGLYFKRLMDREGADKLSPKTLFKAAFAFHQAGNADNEKLAWKVLNDKTRELEVNGDTKGVDDLQEYVAKLIREGSDNTRRTSPIYRGNPSRNAQGEGGTAFMPKKPLWMQPLVREPDSTGVWIKKATDRLQHVKQPILTAFFPVTASGPVGKERKISPLLIYRSYWGVHAVDMKTGRLQWEAHSKWSLDRMLGRGSDGRKMRAMDEWLKYYIDNGQRHSILFENSVASGLSTDNTFVYAVEDLAVPPPHMVNPYGGFTPAPAYGSDVGEAIGQNKLQAFRLATNGKLEWEIGGPDDKNGLDNTYFLGPPLPMGGKIYVLAEKQQELRLVCIDPTARTPDGGLAPKVVSSQMLATTKKKMVEDVLRRTYAAHLAYGEGILVCPTNAGAIFGVDLLSNTLVWAYPYREKGEAEVYTQPGFGRRWPPPGFIVGPDGRLYPVAPKHNQWRVAPPIIQDGKVIFTAPDSQSVHCFNLRDGSPIWSKKRQENDLYLAGVFKDKALIVGKKNCRALSMADGSTLWTLETGLPSGQGVASDGIYYLPLANATKSKDPEICALDVDKGFIHAHTKSRHNHVPGNLLFFEGDVISQTPTEIVAFPQLRVKIAQMDALIAKNPNDPTGLTERGELRLDKGDLAGAIADLSRALKNSPPETVRAKAREKLYDTLTEYFQRDFNRAEEYIKDYEELCKVDMDGATGADKLKMEAEERRRRGNFLCLVAKGREAQGRLVEAFDRYQEFGKVAGRRDELVSVVDEQTVKAAPEVWSRGRITAMIAKATAEQRKPLEDLINRKWTSIRQSAGVDELRQFVDLFGSHFAAGKAARLRLAELLMDETEPNALLEAEQQLNLLRGPDEKPEVAAQAVEALARLYTRKGLLEDAAYCYRLLRDRYPKVIVTEGKTGADLYDDMNTDKRFLPYLDEPVGMGESGKVTAREESGVWRMEYQKYTFPQDGEHLPWFRRYQVALRFGNPHALKLIDRMTGEDRWTKNLTQTMFQNMLNGNGRPTGVRFPMHTTGHLVILPLGHMVFGVDPVSKRVLWEKSLLGSAPMQPTPGMGDIGYRSLTVDPRDGSVQVVYPDGWVQRLGQAGGLKGSVLCLQTRDALLGIDPLTGRTLWTRSDTNPRCHLFTDRENVYVVELAEDNNSAASTRVFRAADGVSVKVPDFASQYQKRMRVLGHKILLSETAAKGDVTMRLYDVLTGKDTWKQTFASNAHVLQSEDPNLVGVIEPDGTVRVVDLRTQKEALVASRKMKAEHMEKVQSYHLLADRQYIYIACYRPLDADLMPFGGVQTNLMPGTGLRCLPVNGALYAFRRDNGKIKWIDPKAENQMIILDHFKDMPMVLMTSRYQKWNLVGGARNVVQKVSVKSIDKRTGKMLIDLDNPGMPQFHALNVDARAGRVELISYNLKVTHTVESAGGGKVAAP